MTWKTIMPDGRAYEHPDDEPAPKLATLAAQPGALDVLSAPVDSVVAWLEGEGPAPDDEPAPLPMRAPRHDVAEEPCPPFIDTTEPGPAWLQQLLAEPIPDTERAP